MPDEPKKPQVRSRSKCFYEVPGDGYVQMRLIKTSYSAIAADIGLSFADSAPENKTNRGKGKQAALLAGCFPVVVVYEAQGGQDQAAKILVAPTKADTALTAIASKTYAGRKISEVRPVRRRVFIL